MRFAIHIFMLLNSGFVFLHAERISILFERVDSTFSVREKWIPHFWGVKNWIPHFWFVKKWIQTF